jgi:hypothetical protein
MFSSGHPLIRTLDIRFLPHTDLNTPCCWNTIVAHPSSCGTVSCCVPDKNGAVTSVLVSIYRTQTLLVSVSCSI